MTPERQYRQFAKKIEEIFQTGLTVGDDVRHYIDSTFANPSLAELETIMADEDDPEVEPLLELIFFPDEAIQVQLETLLEEGDFQAEDAGKMVCRFLPRPLNARIIFPKEEGERTFPVPEWAAEGFVSRLNITKKSDPRLTEAIQDHVDERFRILFKVRLRNSRFGQSEKKILFLKNFFQRIGADTDELPGLVAFILGFLGEISPDADIFRALMDKKKACFRSLQQADRFEKQLAKNNMETLLLQGVRVPHINKTEACQKMAFIDRISFAVFGRSEALEQIQSSVDLGCHEGEDIGKVIRSLS